MRLFHGSSVAGLTTLRPHASNHGKPYVYLTDDPTLALIYAHNPLPRPNGFFTYRYDSQRCLHYDEFFPDQLRLLYQGHSGWVYEADVQALPTLEKMPWVHLSEFPVDTLTRTYIPDLYAALMNAVQCGQLILHRWEDMPDRARESYRRLIQREITEKQLRENPECEYALFIRQYMPDAW